MADYDYKENGATSVISMAGSIITALGFEITDNAKAAITMLKMQKDLIADTTMKDYVTGKYSLKTLQNISNGLWYVPGKLVSWIQKWLASDNGGGYPGSSGLKELTYPNKYDFRGIKTGADILLDIDSNGLVKKSDFTSQWPKTDFTDGVWLLTTYSYSTTAISCTMSKLRYDETKGYSIYLKSENGFTYNYEKKFTIVRRSDGGGNHSSDLSPGSSSITLDTSMYKGVLPFSHSPIAEKTTQAIVSAPGTYVTGGGVTRGGGVGRHSLPKDENFPPCGGDTTVPAITEWSGRVINWNSDCYMPITYYKVNESNKNPGVEKGEPSTAIEPDDPRLDPESPSYDPSIPEDILKYLYPNTTPQTTPQLGTNSDQSTGQLKNNFTNATNGPSDIPSTNVKSGLFTLWHPSSDDLQNLGAFLYGATAQGTIASIIGNPINAIIQLTEWAVTPVDGPEKSPVICNIAATDLKMPTIPNQFMQFDCGSITIPREYSDFRDYEPYTRLSLFLPFVGDVSISTNDCILPHSIKVIYNLDFLSGAACAEVLVDGDVRYAYQAAMCAAIPVTSSDASRLLASLIGAAIGTVGGGIMGGIVGGTAGSRMIAHSIIGGVSDAAMSPINGIQIQRTSSISANTGLLGEMKPYVLVTRPISYIPDSYESLIGRPYQTAASLGSQTGFVKVREVHLDGITATEAEKEEIERLLKEGVIV